MCWENSLCHVFLSDRLIFSNFGISQTSCLRWRIELTLKFNQLFLYFVHKITAFNSIELIQAFMTYFANRQI